MKVPSQLPLIYDSSRSFSSLPAESAVSGTTSPPLNRLATRQVQPVNWTESLDRARKYTLKAQDGNDSFSRHGQEAVSAYSSHDQYSERDYLAKVFGIDTYA